MRDYYQILEIRPGSSAEEIKHAYRKLAKQYHPDINKTEDAHRKFIEITEAYEVLIHQTTYEELETGQQPDYNYEVFIREVREEAQRQARMRYEKFAREHEALRESGLYDVSLLLKYLGKALLPFIAIGLIAIPIGVSVSDGSILPVFYLFFFWVIGGILLFYVVQNRKGYFKLGKFYYSFKKIARFYTQPNETTTEECFYCPGLKANSHPYKIGMVQIKDIRLENNGPLQHSAHYGRKEFTVPFPRSQKAFIVHSISSAIKITAIFFSMLILHFNSFLWRFIGGIIIGWLLSMFVLTITSTRSKSGYLFSYGTIIKIAVWFTVIILLSTFDINHLNIITSDYIKLSMVFLLFADAVIEQVLKSFKRIHLFMPILKYYKNLAGYFENKCHFYLEIPGWTTIYPFIRWLF
jgi:hypothetical protein